MYVTKNLTLPTTIEDLDDITVAWTSSNLSVISSTGVVNRQATDSNVTLTATLSNGTETQGVEFDLVVIRKRSRTVEQAKEEIEIQGVNEIRLMNVDNDDFEIRYSDSRDRITDIDGAYTDITISNADDALDAIQSIHGILGIGDPYGELETNVVTSNAYGAEYTFEQVYDGVRVFGRNITASTNAIGSGDFVASSVIPSATLENATLTFSYSQEQAENIAKEYHEGSFEVRTDATEKVIFTLGSYENNPVPAYIVSIYGNDDEDNYIDENIFVNALNGEVIYTTTNIHATDINVQATNELGELVDMPLEVWDYTDDNGSTWYPKYNMIHYAGSSEVIIYNQKRIGIMKNVVGFTSSIDIDADPQQVSAYTNMIDVMEWWKASFDRDSLDDNGMQVRVVTHERFFNDRDNAFWLPAGNKLYEGCIYICDSWNNARSYALAKEVLTHETTHAVIEYRIGRDFSDNYYGATGAINEGYADIFGCLITGQWKNGLHVYSDDAYERNISDPADPNARQNVTLASWGISHSPTKLSEQYIGIFDNGGVHINSSLISYPAYKMYDYGLPWNKLARVWYESMRMGYSGVSDFSTVRTCVLRAARKLQFTAEEIEIIKKAFDDIESTATTMNLSGNVSNYSGTPLYGVNVKITPANANNGSVRNVTTDSSGNFSIALTAGTYSIEISHSGYEAFSAIVTIENGLDSSMNIQLVTLDSAESTLTGTVKDAQTGYAISNALLEVRSGWNIHTGDTVATCTTNESGDYTLVLPGGYYTIDVSKEDYITTNVNRFVMPADMSIRRNILLSTELDNKYRVTLQWDANPRDLDSHLIGPITNGYGDFHVYFGNKRAYDNSGNTIAILDHDDVSGYGFETITFEMQPGDKFKYYVHWYYGTGTWKGSNAVVNLYKGTQLINTFTVPNVDSSDYEAGYYWYVLDLTSGLDPVQPDDEIVYSAPTLDD